LFPFADAGAPKPPPFHPSGCAHDGGALRDGTLAIRVKRQSTLAGDPCAVTLRCGCAATEQVATNIAARIPMAFSAGLPMAGRVLAEEGIADSDSEQIPP